MTPTSSTEPRDSNRLLAVLIVLVLVAFACYWFLLVALEPAPDRRAVFGDMFGGLSALFTALAFSGVIYTSVLQRRELELQRDQLSQTREELAGQRRELERQNAVARSQLFDGTFFNLMRIHHQIVSDIAYTAPSPAASIAGRAAFDMLFTDILNNYDRTSPHPSSKEQELDAIAAAYSNAFSGHQHDFEHYFKNLYQIFRLIDESAIENREQYISYACAQLSSRELACLFYHCLGFRPHSIFKAIAERNGIFSDFPRSYLLKARHLDLYSASAFA